MKKRLQLVGLVMAALLAVQPALADVLCVEQQGSLPMDAHGCCAASESASLRQQSGKALPQDPQSNALISSATQIQSGCDGGCCSMSPQNAPTPNAPVKATPVRASLVQGSVAAVPTAGPVVQVLPNRQPNASAPARYLLLKVFRI